MVPAPRTLRQRRRLLGACAALCLMLTACGGGGGGGSAASNGPSSNLASSSIVASLPPMTGANVVPILVKAGPGDNVNIPYVTVTVCIPGSNSCTTIDHVLLDTGSIGLRLFASQVDVALPPQSVGGSSDISECAQFLNTVAWGKVTLADVRIGGESAASVPVQLMDATPAQLPTVCGGFPQLSTSTSTSDNTRLLNANGILGVGLFANDGQTYFDCATPDRTACEVTPALNEQVQNPVSLFGISSSNGVANNNGVVVQLPAVPATGAASVQGYLIFGVGTQDNNQLGAANVVLNNPTTGRFLTEYAGAQLAESIMDSGSNGLYFNDQPPYLLSGRCSTTSSDFYCPGATRDLSASIQLDSGMAPVSFSIANADTLFAARGNFVFNNLGGSLNRHTFDWGLPFFFGRSVFTVIEGKTAVHGSGVKPGPFNAYSN